MIKPKLYIHGSYIGNTGYNQHTRDFFRELSKQLQLKVRNFTVGKTWEGHNETPHNKELYINDVDKNILYEQVLWNSKGGRDNYKIYSNSSKEFTPDLNIVLCETDHHLFYDSYKGPKIAYNVWETTKQPEDFFNKLKEFDELWVPSKWQRDCTIAQGYNPDKIKIVSEGVDINTFYPKEETHELTSDGRFKFFLAGRWDYRKSTKEIIETFLKTFDKDEPVDLIVSIDNPFSGDDLETTENRLKHYGLEDERIKIVHFPNREDYIKLLRSSNIFLSCARSEGWNLPLIEAMACGTPSIYSNCSGQLEFAEGRGIPVNIIGEKSASDSSYNHFNGYDGNYYEPDFNHLSEKMKFAYEFYEQVKSKSLEESKEIRNNFSWEKVGNIGYETIIDFYNKVNSEEYKSQISQNKIKVSYLEGPKVEIVGEKNQKYFIEFLDKNNKIIHSDTINNNMWTLCSRKYYTKWKIRVDGKIIDEFDLKDKRVYIHLDSSAIGDTLAWFPYIDEFRKKHNCNVVCSTFHNKWFKDEYSELEFVEPSTEVFDLYAMYTIGWYYDDDRKVVDTKIPIEFKQHPLGETSTSILGLDYFELRPKLTLPKKLKQIEGKYVVIAPHASAHAKYWNNPGGWQAVIDYLNDKGYKVVMITSEKLGDTWHDSKLGGTLKGVINKTGNYPIEDRMIDMKYADAFIGVGSGLSWLAWSIGTPVVMISGFSEPYTEFLDCERVFNYDPNVCTGCFNKHWLNPGDWEWCPEHKDTPRQFECTKTIKPEQVIVSINKVLNIY